MNKNSLASQRMRSVRATLPAPRIAAGDFRRDQDLKPEELRALLDLAREVKRNPDAFRAGLAGKCAGLLFEKPSLRTRFTFELAMQQLGGGFATQIGPIGEREPVSDVARNLDGWVDVIIARTFDQQTVDDLAEWADVPVINALSDMYHPCQALADFQTLEECFDQLEGLKLAFIGDGNNVAHSLMLTAAPLGVEFAIAHPEGYGPDEALVAEARALGGKIRITGDAEEAVRGADAVYTDVWASMGQEHEAYERMVHFEPFRVDLALMRKARKSAIFLHCLPAKRGQEVTHEVVESRQSKVFQQAGNRLHAQKALLLMLLGND
ncbi:MAG: ornithine carbamoyltransferase [Bryobacteraceae bacterium]